MPRYLGQHFLKNKKKIKKIVDALELKTGDVVIEIGPGHGELTDELKVKSLKLKVIAIEKDFKFVEVLQKKFGGDKDIEIIHGDALKIISEITNNLQLTTNNYKIVGNIPYYITGYLLRILGELKHKPLLIILTIQKEVAERICALKPTHSRGRVRMSRPRYKHRGSERYSHAMNLLAASVQFWAEPEIIGYISKKDFSPAPKVDSAIIKLRTMDYGLQPTADSLQLTAKNSGRKPLAVSSEQYYKLIHILFKQPRKTILNNLVSSIKYQVSSIKYQALSEKERKQKREEIIQNLQKININPQDRPQNLSLTDLMRLVDKLF